MRKILSGLAVWVAVSAPCLARASACIDTYRIGHTETPDDRSVLFFMKDRSVFRAVAANGAVCPGLRNNSYGFTYVTDPGQRQLCGNLWTLRQNFSGAVCLMGDFEQVKPPR